MLILDKLGSHSSVFHVSPTSQVKKVSSFKLFLKQLWPSESVKRQPHENYEKRSLAAQEQLKHYV